MPRALSTRLAVALVAAVLVALLWSALHPPRPYLATSDIYTHLSVARHLAHREGFLCDITYPLSFAWPWACRLPQPLIHRPPGYGLLLTPLYLAGGGDPARTLGLVRGLMVLVLGASLGLGFAAFDHQRLRAAMAPWALLWLTSPLVAFVFNWGQVEAVAGLILLALWLRWHPRSPTIPAAAVPARAGSRRLPAWPVDGALCAALTLLRPELSWVPLWWWYGLRRPAPPLPAATTDIAPRTTATTGLRLRREALLGLAVWIALIVPWAGRNWRLTGDPFFALQRYAEHVKQTPAWPEYTVYRSLEPQPLAQTLRTNPTPVLAKTRAGISFYLRWLGGWLPWSLLAAGVLCWLADGRWRRLPHDPLFVVAATGAGLILLYAPFDHELRHLLPLWPVATWELCLCAAGVLNRYRPALGPTSLHRRSLGHGILLLAGIAAGSWLTPARLPGWEHAARSAVDDLPRTAALVARAESLPPGALFCDNAALLWLSGRAGVWAPLDAEVEAELRRRVAPLANAPRLMMDEQ